jgi:excinuclease UvrABC ATPase subunit
MEGSADETLFSARYACPQCGHSIDELEPRLFSFNNPAGACDRCDGLGVTQYFDEGLVVAHPEASLAAGAIRGWDRRNVYYFHLLTSLAKHFDFDIDAPFEALSAEHKAILLHGSQGEELEFAYINDRGSVFKRDMPLKVYCPTWSDVTAIRNHLGSEKSSRNTFPLLHAIAAKARDFALMRETFTSMGERSPASQSCPLAMRTPISKRLK